MSRIIVDLTTGEQTVDADYVGENFVDEEQIAARIEAKKRAAYQAESDPLFFKWQAGEGTEQAWLDKREEINARFV